MTSTFPNVAEGFSFGFKSFVSLLDSSDQKQGSCSIPPAPVLSPPGGLFGGDRKLLVSISHQGDLVKGDVIRWRLVHTCFLSWLY